MEETAIIEGVWRTETATWTQAWAWSGFKLFIQDECVIAYELGTLLKPGRFSMGGKTYRLDRWPWRYTLVLEEADQIVGSCALSIGGWHMELADGSRFRVDSYRVWEEQSELTRLAFETLPGSFWKASIQMRALEGPNFLILSALGFDAFRRLNFDSG
jgi:hypothetical protein